VKLTKLRARVGGRHLATLLRVPESTLRACAAGTRHPSAELRAGLVAHGIALDDWGKPPGAKGRARTRSAASAASVAAKASEASEPRPLGTTREELEALAAGVKEDLALARRDHDVAPAVRSQLAATLARTLRELRSMRGEGELTEAAIARAAPTRRVFEAVFAALDPYPEALRAVRDAVAKLEGA
jgi:hypothetical protein